MSTRLVGNGTNQRGVHSHPHQMQWHHPPASPQWPVLDQAMQILVVGFSFAATTSICNVMQACHCPCSQWEGLHLKSLTNDTAVQHHLRNRLIAMPDHSLGVRAHLGEALSHISAWQSIERQRSTTPTLIVPDNVRLRPTSALQLMGLLTNVSLPAFDILYLNMPQGHTLDDAPDMPKHVKRLWPLPDRGVAGAPKTIGRLSSVYAIRSSGAATLLQLLQRQSPDLSVVPLESWLASTIRRANYTNLQAFSWENSTEFVENSGGKVKAEGGGLVQRAVRFFSTWGQPNKPEVS